MITTKKWAMVIFPLKGNTHFELKSSSSAILPCFSLFVITDIYGCKPNGDAHERCDTDLSLPLMEVAGSLAEAECNGNSRKIMSYFIFCKFY